MSKVDEAIAIEEFKQLYVKHNRKTIDDEKLLEQFPDVIDTLKSGVLVIDGGVPKYELQDPVRNDDGELAVSNVTFKTRILPSEQRTLSNGIDIAKSKMLFVHKCYGFIIGHPVQMLDKFSERDYAVIEQVGSLFI